MAGNRVEELEAKVRELEATINGLTDELIETRERLLTIEEEIAPELERDIVSGRASRAGARQSMDATPEADDETVEKAVDEADEAKGEESEEADNADSESGDDIIVA